jgi:hypothetical protein
MNSLIHLNMDVLELIVGDDIFMRASRQIHVNISERHL